MKKLLHESPLFSIWYEKEKELLSNKWSNKTEDMTDEDFKREILRYGELSLELKVKYLLPDTKDFNFILTPDVQKWHDNVVAPLYLQGKVKKIALIVSADFFSQVSIQQALDEDNFNVIPTQYFEDDESARTWLLGK